MASDDAELAAAESESESAGGQAEAEAGDAAEAELAGPIDEGGSPAEEGQADVLAAEFEARLRGGKLGSAEALDLLIRLEGEVPIEAPYLGTGEYQRIRGMLRERVSWLVKHCFPRVDDEGSYARFRAAWHFKGKRGRWLSKGRVVPGSLKATEESLREAIDTSIRWVLVVNRRWWMEATPTERWRGLWRVFAEEAQGDVASVLASELRLFGGASLELRKLVDALKVERGVASAVQIGLFEGLEEEEDGASGPQVH